MIYNNELLLFKLKNIKNNINNYNDKIIDKSIFYICNNILLYINLLKNQILNNNFNINTLILNDNVFYTGIIILFIAYFLEFINIIRS